MDCWNKPENAHKKPGAKLPDKALSAKKDPQLPSIIVIRQDTLNNNATRNATSQLRKMKKLTLCF
jgi:hypothetical protein